MAAKKSVKESVLQALEEHQGDYLSGEGLSEKLGVSRAAVWKAISSLREMGYRIDAVRNRGYCLQETEAPLDAGQIRRYLPARYRENGLYVYDVIDSTNNLARQIAAGASVDLPGKVAPQELGASADGLTGASRGGSMGASEGVLTGAPPLVRPEVSAGKRPPIHGTVVAALQQTAGKGRLGRSFFSPRQGIYLSIIVKPNFDLSKSVLVTVAAAAAVALAIDDVCGKPEKTQIKWVNDVYLGGKKVCGILTEGITDFESGTIDHLVIGIGVNTSLEGFPEELLQVAGAVEGGYSRSELAAGIIARTLDYLENIEGRAFIEPYRSKSMLIGKQVSVYQGIYRKDPRVELPAATARVLGIDESGGLQVMFADGRRQTLTTGEVTVRL